MSEKATEMTAMLLIYKMLKGFNQYEQDRIISWVSARVAEDNQKEFENQYKAQSEQIFPQE